MDAAIGVALIAAGSGLATSGWTLHRERKSREKLAELEHDWKRREAAEERQLAAKEHLDRFREPLLEAADDLRHRIGNIRNDNFALYLQSKEERRRKLALTSTMYRFGKYWAVVDGLYREVNILRFESESETKRVHTLLTRIGSVIANDRIDGRRLMVWREEQRAIAQLMRPEGSVLGFAGFFEEYESRFEPWFSEMATELQKEGIERSPRLEEVHCLLESLVKQLEAGRRYTA